MVYYIPDCLVCGQGAKPNLRFSGLDVMWLAKYYGTEELAVSIEDQRLVPSTYLNDLFKSWYGITINDSFKQIVQARQEYLKQIVDPVGPCENPRYIEVSTKFSDKKADIVNLVNNPTANVKQDLQAIASSKSTGSGGATGPVAVKSGPTTSVDAKSVNANRTDVSWATKYSDLQPQSQVSGVQTTSSSVANTTDVSSSTDSTDNQSVVNTVRNMSLNTKIAISTIVFLVSYILVCVINKDCLCKYPMTVPLIIAHSLAMTVFLTSWMYDCKSIVYVLVGVVVYAILSLIIMRDPRSREMFCIRTGSNSHTYMTIFVSIIALALNIYVMFGICKQSM
jgi:hypothetical protein